MPRGFTGGSQAGGQDTHLVDLSERAEELLAALCELALDVAAEVLARLCRGLAGRRAVEEREDVEVGAAGVGRGVERVVI